jgi:hypothetical protein
MYDHADVFVVLPGGFGTLDEMFEVITWRQIGIHKKPVIVLNHQGYWDKLESVMEHMVSTGFAKPITREFYQFVDSVEELYKILQLKA